MQFRGTATVELKEIKGKSKIQLMMDRQRKNQQLQNVTDVDAVEPGEKSNLSEAAAVSMTQVKNHQKVSLIYTKPNQKLLKL